MHFMGMCAMCAIHRHVCTSQARAQFTGGLSEAMGMGGQYFAHTACTVMDIPCMQEKESI